MTTSTISLPSKLSTLRQRIPAQYLKLIGIVAFGWLLWYFAQPEELSPQGWSLFVIFVSTIAAIVIKPLAIGGVCLLAISTLLLTKTLDLTTCLHGFSNDLIWLILSACFLARAVIKTGFGKRVAYLFITLCGASPFGLSYGLLLSSITMAAIIPSTTARTGGIIMPVLAALIQAIQGTSKASTKESNNTAAFLTLTVFHGSVIASALFITANAGNPIAIKFAASHGVSISWAMWAGAALVPGLITIALLPVLIRYFCPCSIAHKQEVAAHAKEELHAMGRVSFGEKGLIAVFSLLLGLWSLGPLLGVHATEAAIFGVAALLIIRVLEWKDIVAEELAWDTFFWLATLLMMASELQHQGVTTFFTSKIVHIIPTSSWQLALTCISCMYFYSHYLFASTTAHISAMFPPFLALAIATGAPPEIATLTLGFLSSLFGGLTNYSSGPAPILFAQGFVDIKTWWKIGAITSIVYLLIWLGIGPLWWRVLF